MAEGAPFDAVVFDMDGVLVDGEPLHYAAVSALLAEDGVVFPLECYKTYMGTKAGWTEFVETLSLPHPADHYRGPYNERVLASYRDVTEPLPGAMALVAALSRAGLPLAVASSSRRSWVAACLGRIGLADAFDVVVTGDDIEQGKPDPEIYWLAAELLGVSPERCLAIEDAPAGIESAHAAGMTCWAVRTDYTRDLALPNPERTVESLTEIELADIAAVAA